MRGRSLIGDQFLWVEKYRPKKVSECILPDRLKGKFQGFVDEKNIPNLILVGSAGCGKTTVARAMIREIGADELFLNGSNDRNIDTLRNELTQFASSVSLAGGRKYVILDEADYLNPQSTQPALRGFMEQYAKNCGFILTCNFPHKLVEPLHSRCSVVDFKLTASEKTAMARQMHKRLIKILEENGVKVDHSVLAELIIKFVPDWRRCLNELQRYSVNGVVDSGILINIGDAAFAELIEFLKNKRFTEVRKWLKQHSDMDTASLYRMFYDNAKDFLDPSSIPELILILGEHQHYAAFVADHEINNAACFAKIMGQCLFK